MKKLRHISVTQENTPMWTSLLKKGEKNVVIWANTSVGGETQWIAAMVSEVSSSETSLERKCSGAECTVLA